MRHFTLAAAVSLVLTLLTGCGANTSSRTSSSPTPPQPQPHIATTDTLTTAECGTIPNLHSLGGVFLAGQPKAEDFAEAKKQGVETVINLRHAAENKDFDEKQVAEAAGLTYINLPWGGSSELTDAVFDQSRELLKTAERPILLHCATANRVGAVWLPHRVLDDGLTWDDALAEARTVGLRTPDFEAKAKDYIQRHGK
jgi:uncharacterized protein (TIGR01244 family)